MSKRADLAQKYLLEGYNCSQSVILAFIDDYDVDKDSVLQATAVYGSGMGDGEVCGAVSGGVAVVGLKYGKGLDAPREEKVNAYLKAKAFMDAFKAERGTVQCYKLLGLEVPYFSEEGAKYLEENNSGMTVCLPVVRLAAEILEEQGY